MLDCCVVVFVTFAFFAKISFFFFVSRMYGPAPRSLCVIFPFRSPISAHVLRACLAFVPFGALFDFQRTLAGSPVFHLVLNRLSVAVSIASLLSPMFVPLANEWPVGAKYGDVLTHCLYGHAAHHSKAGWVFPTIFDVLTPFATDYKYTIRKYEK